MTEWWALWGTRNSLAAAVKELYVTRASKPPHRMSSIHHVPQASLTRTNNARSILRPSAFLYLYTPSTPNAGKTNTLRNPRAPEQHLTQTKKPSQSPSATSTATGSLIQQEKKQKKQTVEEADEELRQKLEAISGEGGEAGLELEAGKPVAMKRGVRENMFRVI